MSELAFNIQGEPFQWPAQATGLRVRSVKGKGPPGVVYGADGLPLYLAADATLDDLKAAVTTSGRYRLDPVDLNNKSIADAPSAYVHVNLDVPSSASAVSLTAKPTDNVVIEAIRSQSAMALAVIERFPQMMDSAANLLRAADGAGLPAREPRIVDQDDDDHDDNRAPAPAASSGFDLNALFVQWSPLLMALLSGGKLQIPGLGEMLDWRKAVPNAAPKPTKAIQAPATVPTIAARPHKASENTAQPAEAEGLPPLDPQTMMHFIAIQSALKPDEAALAREVAGELAPAELRAWIEELSKLSVPDAVVKIRALIGSTPAATTGGAA